MPGTQIDTDVALLRQELGQSNIMLDKLDRAIEKISDVNHTMSRIIAIHEDRMERIEKFNHASSLLQEKQNEQIKNEMDEIQAEIGKKIDSSEVRVMVALEKMKTEIRQDFKEYKKDTDDRFTSVEEESKSQSEKITKLEKWRYYIAGGVAVLGIILAKLDVLGRVIDVFLGK